MKRSIFRRRHLCFLVPLLFAGLVQREAHGATLERHPYLQQGSTGSMIVVWNTVADAQGELRWGTSPTALTNVVTTGLGTQHEALVTGLSAGTTYYYAVYGDGGLLAGEDVAHFFTTNPPTSTPAKFRAWVVGDSGTGGSAQAAVRDSMLGHVKTTSPNIYLHMGDMAYSNGTTAEFTSRFYAVYEQVLQNTVCWPTMGNHERPVL